MRFASETRLRFAFAEILATCLATGTVLVAGCGGGTTSDVTSTNGGSSGSTGTAVASLCTGGPELGGLLETMHTTPPLDGAEHRSESAFPATRTTSPYPVSPDPQVTGDGWTGTVSDKVGTLCAGATDVAACQAKVDGFRILPTTAEACAAQFGTTAPFDNQQCHATYILYTRGDDVRVARTVEETKALLSTIDTVGEALWLASNGSYATQCGSYPAGAPESTYRRLANGNWELADLVTGTCGEPVHRVTVQVDYAGTMTVTSDVTTSDSSPCPVAGRRPAGLQREAFGPRGNDVGEHFAAMAQLEAASVIAFRRLQRSLASHGAPPELLVRVRKAAHDEIRHARSTSALARKYGVVPASPQIAAETVTPSLFALAVENAREGCVRETYGALVAHAQARVATDLDVRRAMLVIADEETEHAALSWDIAAWIESQLDPRARQLLARERRDALRVLAAELAEPVPAHVSAASGVPSSRDALRMLDGLAPTLLAA